ncbi:putative zinc finger protein [Paramyrothecium foliicola]|nr:putative zinc finger protein [Paramyrothecium foliicola]
MIAKPNDNLESVVEALQFRPEADADTIVRRIRNGDNVELFAQHLRYGDLLLQAFLVPETRYRYEFPLHSECRPRS